MKMKNIAIFASGEGTNAQRIIDYFRNSPHVKVSLIVSNNAAANVLNRAKNAAVPTLLINRVNFYENNNTIEQLNLFNIDFIILAGFLWMIPENLIKAYPYKIINIHPALLPKHGGKGMYGIKVHQSVINSKEKESGITIHYVNEKYDEGKIIAQYKCTVSENDSAEILAAKIHELEYEHFPKEIEKLLCK